MTPQEAKARAAEKARMVKLLDLANAMQRLGVKADELKATLDNGGEIGAVLGAMANDLWMQVYRDVNKK